MKKCLSSLVVFGIAVLVITPRAQAACITPDRSSSSVKHVTKTPSLAAPRAGAAADGGNSIVGLWSTTFYVGETTDVWDQAFEQWHSDGTELAVDNAVPPILGNVCVGVWVQDARTIRLRHVTWNWNLDGTKAGTFLLEATIGVDRGGLTFTGTYVSDSFDVDGNVIPELHGEGVVRGTRISAD